MVPDNSKIGNLYILTKMQFKWIIILVVLCSQFTGEWNEIERSFYLFESSLSCTKLNFTLYSNDTMVADVNYRAPWSVIFTVF